MNDTGETITLRVHGAIAEIAPEAWDACAGDINPTVSHVFLNALEESGSCSARSGWAPQHLSFSDPAGRIIGAVPMYLKSHSYGEYVFDWGWADAYERSGGRYYPKLLCAVPFTPVPGPRLLIAPGAPVETKRHLHHRHGARIGVVVHFQLIGFRLDVKQDAALDLGGDGQRELLQTEDFEAFGEAGFLPRIGQQFHWTNDGYRDFDDYLAALNSRKRKAVKKERREALADGRIEIEVLTGSDLTPRVWDAFFRLYLATTDRKWGSAYLNRRFFALIGERMPDKVVLVMAKRNGDYIAGAFNILGRETIYGRNWGSPREYRFLHFECCYYSAIEFAIAHGLKRVEAGAQGPHKLQRGYLPVPTYSAHWIPDPRFRRAVASFLDQEREMVAQKIEHLAEYSPFRHETDRADED